MEIKPIAYMSADFTTKFGLPRQSRLSKTVGRVIFEEEYSDPNAFRGLEGFSHIWLIWGFNNADEAKGYPMVKPPRLGGKKRMGVFATRASFRPNSLGLSCVKLLEMRSVGRRFELTIEGSDLMNGTPIYDVKPYLTYADSVPDASEGFAAELKNNDLCVDFPDKLKELIPPDKLEPLCEALAGDPRPHYHNDPSRRYGFEFAGFDVRFRVSGDTLTVCEIVKL